MVLPFEHGQKVKPETPHGTQPEERPAPLLCARADSSLYTSLATLPQGPVFRPAWLVGASLPAISPSL